MTDYFDELAERLREHGARPDEVRATLDDLASFAAESGADPHSEFGPVGEFARQLTAGGGAEQAPPAPRGQDTWRWSADVFSAPRKLAEFGAQGWEMEEVDRFGAFLSRRDPDSPQQWEYRQEIADSYRSRAALARRLAPQGWEECGHWSVFVYLKRPKAASEGPAARVSDPPAVPRRRFFLGWAGTAAVLAALIAAGFALVRGTTLAGEALGGESAGGADAAAELAGMAVGAVVGAGAVLLAVWAVSALVARLRARRG
ncbi:DUF2812 domain-containing protein [Streptomonospora litoralis]|uniref:DUF2812 domain-containing protein n=1 Tax=Streptomonospora litoralis TaxID=2498135 RepID=A0A4P6Q3X7_9ACTN|nr:DUF2812 domain-containing protein [Streptomonospora litoralis]QBI53524.1 hypothetical protein EKD16_08650 [Streptomonospora litoralis]